MYNALKLHEELAKAGLPVVGVSSDERVHYSRDLTIDEEVLAGGIISAHDPYGLSTAQLNNIDAQNARVEFKNLPDWATWTPTQGRDNVRNAILNGQTSGEVDTWIDANVTSIATARTALKLLAGAIIDLRNIVSLLASAILYLRDVSMLKSRN